MENLELVEGKVDWKGRPAVKYKHGGIKTSLLILAAFGFENLATIALGVNLVTYFNGVLHLDLAEAANQVTNYMGTSYILSIVVALLADAFIGRFKAVLISGSVEFLGLALITIQAHYPDLKPPPCNVFDPTAGCKKIEGSDAALLFVALYLIATGTAGIKAALPPYGADQFDEKDPIEARQMSSFFNLLFLAVCIGGAISVTLIVWIQDNKGWDRGFGLSSVAVFLATIIFAAGLPLYRFQVVQGSSVLIEIIQKTSTENLEITEAPNPWKLCRVTQVENAKIILGMIPIFCCTIVMTLCLAQLQTFSIQQGLTMDTSVTTSFHIPPASLPILPILFMILAVPVYDRIFVPFAGKITGNPTGITHLQRVGVGLVLSCISMAIAAIFEVIRKDVARDHNMLDAIPVVQPLPISTFWLSIQFFIFGIADMFTYVGLLEFFYSEAPKGIKSLSTCFLWCSMALGYFFSTILVNIVNSATRGITQSGGWLAGNNINRNHLNLFFWLLSALSFINFSVYLFMSSRYNYRPQTSVGGTACKSFSQDLSK
ncbi:hypothetical protein KPL70_005293 [Citrus sinensis]|nr:hypothetical protein KPL70_005293 [Citrus sinensis]